MLWKDRHLLSKGCWMKREMVCAGWAGPVESALRITGMGAVRQ
jgi:hypothetical protein